ncbi:MULTISPECIES: Ig-like domain-containing protein, partial [unclassified Pseudomonas]|uniref:Ig-like domain-containing protein n=1 Tax=unclassified Pseudomonas TaxID=196821 RepID=UPI001EFDF569
MATDNTISLAEAAAGVTLSGTAEAGSTVTVTYGGHDYAATTTPAGTWSVLVPVANNPGYGNQNVTVWMTDLAGNVSPSVNKSVFVSESVNTYVAGDQGPANNANFARDSVVTGLSDGGWVITWNSDNGAGTGKDVYQQRFGADGHALGAETRVNTTTINTQEAPEVTALADGGWLVTWLDNQGGINWSIRQQRYNADGSANGTEVVVKAASNQADGYSDTAQLNDGGWVTTWSRDPGDGTSLGIIQQRFNADGTPSGGMTTVNTTAAGVQRESSIAALSDGGWVVTWWSQNQDGSGWGVYQRRYSAAGATVGGEVRVNSTTANDQYHAETAGFSADQGGGWIVSWTDGAADGSGAGIYLQRYDATGVAVGGETRVNGFTTGTQAHPSIAVLSDGGWVVTWHSNNQVSGTSGYDVYLQRYDALGNKKGSEQLVNSFTAGDQTHPSVTATADEGFTISWTSNGQDGSGAGVYQRHYDASGSPLSKTITLAAVSDDVPAIVDDIANGGATNDTTPTLSGTLSAVLAVGELVEVLRNGVVVATLAPSGTTWSYTDSTLANGSYGYSVRIRDAAYRYSVETPVHQIVVDTVLVTPTIATVAGDNTISLAEAESLTLSGTAEAGSEISVTFGNQTYTTTATATGTWSASVPSGDMPAYGNHLISVVALDAAGNTANTSKTVLVSESVNTTVSGSQGVGYNNTDRASVVAALADGGWIVVWDGDGNGINISQQRFDANGKPVGVEIQISTGSATSPEVIGLADGGWLATWNVSGGGGFQSSVQQRYNADGTVNGPQISITSGYNIEYLDSAQLSNGSWIVSWSGGFSGTDIFYQRVSTSGTHMGSVTTVNTAAGMQRSAHVAALADGGWVITWESSAQDGSGWGVYQRRYNASGVAQGGEILINTTTSGDQNSSDVASFSATQGGGWVVVWTDSGADGSGKGIFMKRYNATGTAVGVQTQVNTYTAGVQEHSSVAILSDGSWVVAWQSMNQFSGSSGYDIYLQRYNADGTLNGTETLVNSSYTVDGQYQSSITATQDGGFTITWTSLGQDGQYGGIYQKHYAPTPFQALFNEDNGGQVAAQTAAAAASPESPVVASAAGNVSADSSHLVTVKASPVMSSDLQGVTNLDVRSDLVLKSSL